MCLFCELDASESGGAPSRFSATEPGSRRAAPVNLEAGYGAAAAAMPEGVGVQGRRTLIKGGTILSMDDRVGNHAVGDYVRAIGRDRIMAHEADLLAYATKRLSAIEGLRIIGTSVPRVDVP